MHLEPTDGESPRESAPFPYQTAQAFRRALRDRFAAIAKVDPRFSLDALQRQFAYDRLLARAFTGPDASRWVLKGAGALLARLEVARHSQDIDMLYQPTSGVAKTAGQVRGGTDRRGSGC
jgi:hypothetical protein